MMADQKKTSTRKSQARKKPARTLIPDAGRGDIVPAHEAAPARRTRTRRPEAAPKRADATGVASLFDAQLPADMRAAIEAAEAIAPASGSLALPALPETGAVPAAQLLETGAAQARETYVQARAAGESLRQAMAETAQATTLGALEVNGRMMEALRAQSDVAFDLWRAALRTNSLSDAISLQATGARQVYETAANHWADVAESTRRWLGATVRPFQATWPDRTR
jgi:hypothetical protein